jgi:hypothetical protein
MRPASIFSPRLTSVVLWTLNFCYGRIIDGQTYRRAWQGPTKTWPVRRRAGMTCLVSGRAHRLPLRHGHGPLNLGPCQPGHGSVSLSCSGGPRQHACARWGSCRRARAMARHRARARPRGRARSVTIVARRGARRREMDESMWESEVSGVVWKIETCARFWERWWLVYCYSGHHQADIYCYRAGPTHRAQGAAQAWHAHQASLAWVERLSVCVMPGSG